MNQPAHSTRINFAFYFHLFITLLSWTGPFLFSWQYLLPVYILIQLQFIFLGKCVLNEHHGQAEQGDATFHSELLEKMGFQFPRPAVKRFIRRWAYPGKMLVLLLWQVVLGQEALIF